MTSFKSYSSIVLFRPDTYDRRRLAQLEPGVGRLILILEKLGCRSLFSCEGHDGERDHRGRAFRTTPYVSFTLSTLPVPRLLLALAQLCGSDASIEVGKFAFVLRVTKGRNRKVIDGHYHTLLTRFYNLVGGEDDVFIPDVVYHQQSCDPVSLYKLLNATTKIEEWLE